MSEYQISKETGTQRIWSQHQVHKSIEVPSNCKKGILSLPPWSWDESNLYSLIPHDKFQSLSDSKVQGGQSVSEGSLWKSFLCHLWEDDLLRRCCHNSASVGKGRRKFVAWKMAGRLGRFPKCRYPRPVSRLKMNSFGRLGATHILSITTPESHTHTGKSPTMIRPEETPRTSCARRQS